MVPSHPGRHSRLFDWSGLALLASDVSYHRSHCRLWRPTPLLDMHPEIIWLSGCLTILTRHSGRNSSSGRRLTYCLPSDPCRLYLDSSENITLSHCACDHLACSLAHCNLAVIGQQCLVLGSSCCQSTLNNRLRTVLALTFTPDDCSQSRLRSVDEALLSF